MSKVDKVDTLMNARKTEDDGRRTMTVEVKLIQQENESGDVEAAAQGFGRVATERPPAFDPHDDCATASSFFEAHGFVVLSNCLDDRELGFLNEFCERTQAERPRSGA